IPLLPVRRPASSRDPGAPAPRVPAEAAENKTFGTRRGAAFRETVLGSSRAGLATSTWPRRPPA
ncbi:MAG TPA: hypothetical protein VGM93_08575, partial [Acidimicrobiales bacterium]